MHDGVLHNHILSLFGYLTIQIRVFLSLFPRFDVGGTWWGSKGADVMYFRAHIRIRGC